MLRNEPLHVVIRAIENDVDVVVSRLPRIVQQALTLFLEDADALIAQPVQRIAERPAPLLGPAARSTDVASAVELPAPDAVAAAPRSPLENFHFILRRILGQKLGVVGE